MAYEEIPFEPEGEMPDMYDGEDSVAVFGSGVVSEGEPIKKSKERKVTAEEAKAAKVGARISVFLTRKLGENAVQLADVAGKW